MHLHIHLLGRTAFVEVDLLTSALLCLSPRMACGAQIPEGTAAGTKPFLPPNHYQTAVITYLGGYAA